MVRSGSGQPAPRPAPRSITWLVLSWLSVVLTAWPPGGSHSQMPHHTRLDSGPQSFSHTHSPNPCYWQYLEMRAIWSLFLQCTESRKNKMLSLHTLPPPGDHKYLFYKSKALLQLHIPMRRANFSDAYLSLILCTTDLSFDYTWQSSEQKFFLFRPAAETLKFGFVALPRSLFWSWLCYLELSRRSVSFCDEMTSPDKLQCLLHKLTEPINSSTRYLEYRTAEVRVYHHLG